MHWMGTQLEVCRSVFKHVKVRLIAESAYSSQNKQFGLILRQTETSASHSFTLGENE